MTEVALQYMSPLFQEIVNRNKSYFELGVIAPDRLFKDTINHYYNVSKGVGKVHKKVSSEVQLIKKMLANLDRVILHEKAEEYLYGIMDTPLKTIVFELGVISHYIADARQPLHTDSKKHYSDMEFTEELVHKIYEFDARRKDNLMELKSNSIREINAINKERKKKLVDNEVEDFILSSVKEGNKYYDVIVDAYYLSPTKIQTYKSGRYKKVRDLTQKCFNNAVRDIISIWKIFESDNNFTALSKDLHLSEIINKVYKSLDKNKTYSIHQYKNGNIKLIRC